MQKELNAAANLIARLLHLSPSDIPAFQTQLCLILSARYANLWHPALHSAYRAITSFPGRMDPVILQALALSGISIESVHWDVKRTELIVWVDPGEVAYRIGEKGVVVTVYKESESWQKGEIEKRKAKVRFGLDDKLCAPPVFVGVA